MRNLWKALTLLALDEPLRNEVAALAKFDNKPDLGLGLEKRSDLQQRHFDNQPNVPTLLAIDQKFRAKGIFLAAYDLAEINRWMKDGGAQFLDALKSLNTALAPFIVISPGNMAALEAVGALVADIDLRASFEK